MTASNVALKWFNFVNNTLSFYNALFLVLSFNELNLSAHCFAERPKLV